MEQGARGQLTGSGKPPVLFASQGPDGQLSALRPFFAGVFPEVDFCVGINFAVEGVKGSESDLGYLSSKATLVRGRRIVE